MMIHSHELEDSDMQMPNRTNSYVPLSQTLEELGDTLNDVEIDELTTLVTAAEAVTRKVRLRGHTLREERAILAEQYRTR
ncbi:MAG: hypothetical protein SCM11_13445 [Bacillota bacterium]|nr:hypothetical protein [Bacillota bacterium]